jgi:hypothetical protein
MTDQERIEKIEGLCEKACVDSRMMIPGSQKDKERQDAIYQLAMRAPR